MAREGAVHRARWELGSVAKRNTGQQRRASTTPTKACSYVKAWSLFGALWGLDSGGWTLGVPAVADRSARPGSEAVTFAFKRIEAALRARTVANGWPLRTGYIGRGVLASSLSWDRCSY